MSQIFLFTGENSFLLREERRRWVGEFTKKYGMENCAVLDGSHMKIRELLDEIAVLPFLAEKRLVVVDGVPKSTKEEIQLLPSAIHPHVLLVFVDAALDKRTAGAKEILKSAEVKEFHAMKGPALLSWMNTYGAANGLTFGTKTAEALYEFIGDDQAMLAQEIQKLSQFAQGKPLTIEDVERNVIPTDEGVIWKISDLLSNDSKPQALTFAHRMLERGGDAYGLWAILLNMLKNLVAVHAAMNAGITSQKDIADETGVHIFAVRSLTAHARRVKNAELVPFLSWAADADKSLKTGGFRSTDESPQELLALIDRFILTCP